MTITPLVKALTDMGVRVDRARAFEPALEDVFHEFSINTSARQAAFLAQIVHESGYFRFLVELWGPTATQARYELRQDLGNCEPGDGFRFRGRGLLQTTGRTNYLKTGQALGMDLIADPEKLGEPGPACRSAGWFWKAHGCNELADAGKFEAITRTINGGLNGYPERLGLWEKAKEVLA